MPSWLVQKEPMWQNKLDGEECLDVVVSMEYILEPFPKNLFEPYCWHEIFATLDVSANIHTTKHCNDDIYDIMSAFMVKVIQESKELGMDSKCCDKELILEGP